MYDWFVFALDCCTESNGIVTSCPKMMDTSSAGMAYGGEVASADWIHVKNCTLDACKATSELQDLSSLTK